VTKALTNFGLSYFVRALEIIQKSQFILCY
jgi:hypothetical protein